MSDAIQSVAALQSAMRAGPQAAPDASAEGVYRGERVVVQADHHSILQDAAEEIATFHGERTSKDIAKRKATDRQGRAAELADRLVQRVPDIGQPGRFHQLADSLKKLGTALQPQQLRQMLREQFGDISHQYAALQYLDELLSESDEQAPLLAQVRQLRSEYDTQHGPEVRAGLNITGVALRFEQLDGPQRLRDFYRDTILSFDDVAVAHETILGRYGEAQFELAAEFLIHAVGEDLSSEGPSVDPRKLKATIDNLYAVQVARNAHVQLDELLARVASGYGIVPQASTSDLLSELLPLKNSRWVDVNKIDAVVSRLGAIEIDAKIYFLQGIGSLVASLPEKIFQTNEDRDRLRSAIQQAIDRAIDQEGL